MATKDSKEQFEEWLGWNPRYKSELVEFPAFTRTDDMGDKEIVPAGYMLSIHRITSSGRIFPVKSERLERALKELYISEKGGKGEIFSTAKGIYIGRDTLTILADAEDRSNDALISPHAKFFATLEFATTKEAEDYVSEDSHTGEALRAFGKVSGVDSKWIAVSDQRKEKEAQHQRAVDADYLRSANNGSEIGEQEAGLQSAVKPAQSWLQRAFSGNKRDTSVSVH